MQVSVETLSDLERRVTVQIPAETFTRDIQDRMRSLSKTVRLHGFRQGKIPLKVIDRFYGDQIRQEIVGKLLESSLREALVQENLNPLHGPKIESQPLKEGRDFEYTATFEILPELEPAGFDQIQVERPVAEVTEQDVDRMIETLRRQQAVWNGVERPARAGDRVRIDFAGKLDGQDFVGGKGDNVWFVLGAGELINEFEEQLIDLTAGAEIAFDVTFPSAYYAKEIAGRSVRFQVKLHAVEEASLPEVDEAFVASLDVKEGGVAALRQALRENMERELRSGIKTLIKRQVLQGLLEANPFPLPRALVAAEVENLAKQTRFPADSDDEKTQEIKKRWLVVEACRRVALGLLISRLATTQEIQVDNQQIHDHLESVAASYQNPAEILSWYEQTPGALDNVRAVVLEDQVVEWVLERARVSERASTFAEIMNPVRLPGRPAQQEFSE
ncbi:MAG: trigger factor [Candidatus Competibacteraceae bacterium]